MINHGASACAQCQNRLDWRHSDPPSTFLDVDSRDQAQERRRRRFGSSIRPSPLNTERSGRLFRPHTSSEGKKGQRCWIPRRTMLSLRKVHTSRIHDSSLKII